MKPLYRYTIYALLAIVLLQQAFLYMGQRARRAERINAANALAAHSTTERRYVAQLQIATRYIRQGQVALEKALRDRPATPKVAVDARLEARRDTATVSPPLVADGTSVHFTAGFGSLDTMGYHIENDVTIAGVGPILGAEPRVDINYDVTLAAALYKVRVSCEGPNARVAIAGPRWRGITIDSTSAVSEDVCNRPAPSWQPFTLRAPSLPWAAALVGLGFVLRSSLK